MFDLGLFDFFILSLVYLHLVAIVYSLYVHRYLCHEYYEFKKPVKIFFETLMWLFSGPAPIQLPDIHIRHHKTADTLLDPHSPIGPVETPKSIKKEKMKYILFSWTFTSIIAQFKMLLKPFVKVDFPTLPERQKNEIAFMQNYPHLGNLILLGINILLFGFWGLLFYILQVVLNWIFVITYGHGIVHLFGYKNFTKKDNVFNNSRNTVPFGIFFCGEELHNNHHKLWNVNFKHKWYEFDLGYVYIWILCKLKLCTLNEKFKLY